MTDSGTVAALDSIFFAYAGARRADVLAKNTRFVHYTSAEVAVKILESKQIWMRRSSTMNDFMEVRYGIGCLARAYSGPSGQEFRETLDVAFPGFRPRLEKWFDGWANTFRLDTYLTCFSEHHNDEDANGRLSMWRAYGGSTGVALVVRNTPFMAESDALRVYSSPVAYLTREEFAHEFQQMGRRVAANAPFLRAQGEALVDASICWMFRFAALCTKHPGFKEELEWRAVHSPSFEPSARVTRSIETIDGVPQPVVKVPLKDYPDEGFVGAEIPQFLDRIIIGPTQHPEVIRDAFCEILKKAGVPDAPQRVHISDIPLRQAR